MKKTYEEYMDSKTGEVPMGKLNELITTKSRRANGSLRIIHDYSNCPTMAEQHTAHLTDINYLIKKFRPDEFAAYISQKNANRQSIEGHDFSQEPDLQGAMNIKYKLKKSFEELPDDVKMHFSNHIEFLKFIDNPANAAKMLKLGLMTKRQIQDNTTNTNHNQTTQNPEKTKTDTESKTKT